jgi:GDP-4-dehydro-6-deoxy-D-mannose reductase
LLDYRGNRLRPFNHTGPGQSPQFVVAAFAQQLTRIAAGLQAPVIQVGNLETWRDFLDVRDVCTAYVACIAKRDSLAPGTIFNLASKARSLIFTRRHLRKPVINLRRCGA